MTNFIRMEGKGGIIAEFVTSDRIGTKSDNDKTGYTCAEEFKFLAVSNATIDRLGHMNDGAMKAVRASHKYLWKSKLHSFRQTNTSDHSNAN